MDNGRGHSRNTVKEAYNRACAAVDDYNYRYPGTNLQLEALNLADNDPHNENDVQIPIEFTGCTNLTKMGEDLSRFARTDCYIGYTTSIDRGEVMPQHILHIDPRVEATGTPLYVAVMRLPPVVRLLGILFLFYMAFKFLL